MPDKNAAIGTDAERLFKNSVGRHPNVIYAIKSRFGINGNFARAYKTGSDAGRSDVIVAFDDNRRLSANVKAFAAGFNQLTRATIATFCNEFNLGSLRSGIEAGAIRKAGKTGRFIDAADELTIIAAFQPIVQRIGHFSLARLENPELLVLIDRNANRMHLDDMADVFRNLHYTVTLTPRGTIMIGG